MKKTNRTYAGKPTKSKKQFRQIRNLFILTLILVALIGYYENSFEIEQAQAIQIQPAIQIYPEPETDLKKYVLTEVYKAGLNPDYVERLLHCESTWNNEAHTLEPNSTVSSGVWQINSVHKATISPSERFDIEKSTEWAINKRLHDGNWSAWSCSRLI